MSILKKENNADRNKLISLMQSASKGSYILCDENDFKDKELAQTYNALMKPLYRLIILWKLSETAIMFVLCLKLWNDRKIT